MINIYHNPLIEKALNASTTRQKVIANNVANVDTPYYKRQYVTFEEELRAQLSNDNTSFTGIQTNSKHIPIGKMSSSNLQQLDHTVHEEELTSMNNNKNNVDIDMEMTSMAANQLRYNVLVDRVSGHYQKYKNLLRDLK